MMSEKKLIFKIDINLAGLENTENIVKLARVQSCNIKESLSLVSPSLPLYLSSSIPLSLSPHPLLRSVFLSFFLSFNLSTPPTGCLIFRARTTVRAGHPLRAS